MGHVPKPYLRYRGWGSCHTNISYLYISHLFLMRNINADDFMSSCGTWSMNWTFIFIGTVFALPTSSPTWDWDIRSHANSFWWKAISSKDIFNSTSYRDKILKNNHLPREMPSLDEPLNHNQLWIWSLCHTCACTLHSRSWNQNCTSSCIIIKSNEQLDVIIDKPSDSKVHWAIYDDGCSHSMPQLKRLNSSNLRLNKW